MPDMGGSPGQAILHAYDAATMRELYTATTDAKRDVSSGAGIKFSVPTIANGEVFVGTSNSVAVYGLIPAVTRLSLVNADTGKIVPGYARLSDGQTIVLHDLPPGRLAIVASTNVIEAGSVRYAYDAISNFETDNMPFSPDGVDRRYLPWPLGRGNHTITATPYTLTNGRGLRGTSLTIHLHVT